MLVAIVPAPAALRAAAQADRLTNWQVPLLWSKQQAPSGADTGVQKSQVLPRRQRAVLLCARQAERTTPVLHLPSTQQAPVVCVLILQDAVAQDFAAENVPVLHLSWVTSWQSPFVQQAACRHHKWRFTYRQ